jgi:hypothetical protein
LFFFYKIKIVPVHFWMARRFLPVILPGAMLLVGYAAFRWLQASPLQSDGGEAHAGQSRRAPWQYAAAAAGAIVVMTLGFQFWRASQPLLTHVEYAGLIPKLEALAKNFGDRDLVVVESRASGSELHVLALRLRAQRPRVEHAAARSHPVPRVPALGAHAI